MIELQSHLHSADASLRRCLRDNGRNKRSASRTQEASMFKGLKQIFSGRQPEENTGTFERLGEYVEERKRRLPSSRDQRIESSVSARIIQRSHTSQAEAPQPESEKTAPQAASSTSGAFCPIKSEQGASSAKLTKREQTSCSNVSAETHAGPDLSRTVRRLTQEINGANMRQTRLLERIDALTESLRESGQGATGIASISGAANLDAMIRETFEQIGALPQRESVAIERLESLASTANTNAATQTQMQESLSGMRNDLREFLAGISSSVERISDLHREAISTCQRLSQRQEQTIRSQRMHMVELRRQQDEAIFEIEREHRQRLSLQNRRVKKASRRQLTISACMLISMMACVAMVANIASGVANINASSVGMPTNMAKEQVPVQSRHMEEDLIQPTNEATPTFVESALPQGDNATPSDAIDG